MKYFNGFEKHPDAPTGFLFCDERSNAKEIVFLRKERPTQDEFNELFIRLLNKYVENIRIAGGLRLSPHPPEYFRHFNRYEMFDENNNNLFEFRYGDAIDNLASFFCYTCDFSEIFFSMYSDLTHSELSDLLANVVKDSFGKGVRVCHDCHRCLIGKCEKINGSRKYL